MLSTFTVIIHIIDVLNGDQKHLQNSLVTHHILVSLTNKHPWVLAALRKFATVFNSLVPQFKTHSDLLKTQIYMDAALDGCMTEGCYYKTFGLLTITLRITHTFEYHTVHYLHITFSGLSITMCIPSALTISVWTSYSALPTHNVWSFKHHMCVCVCVHVCACVCIYTHKSSVFWTLQCMLHTHNTVFEHHTGLYIALWCHQSATDF